MKNRGLVQIYTGDGKGKTTAAVGLAARAVSHGLKVCYVCFHKDPAKWDYGEHKTLKELGVEVLDFAREHPHFHRQAKKSEIRKKCLEGLKFIKEVLYKPTREYNIIILDEILISLRDGFLKEGEVLGILDLKPKDTELVLTGRGATKKILQKAHLVTYMKKVKHPYDSGIRGRKGIEF